MPPSWPCELPFYRNLGLVPRVSSKHCQDLPKPCPRLKVACRSKEQDSLKQSEPLPDPRIRSTSPVLKGGTTTPCVRLSTPSCLAERMVFDALGRNSKNWYIAASSHSNFFRANVRERSIITSAHGRNAERDVGSSQNKVGDHAFRALHVSVRQFNSLGRHCLVNLE